MDKIKPVDIVGAGIGGLALAAALGARGYSVRVFERSDRISEAGAGVQITPNGVAVLSALGLGETLERAGTRAAAVRLLDHARGAPVATLDVSQGSGGRGYFLLHRADLIDMLAEACRASGADLCLGQPVGGLRVDGDKAVFETPEGEVETAAMVGADGIRSVVRPAVLGDAPARFSGQVAWRALVPGDGATPPEARVHMGPGKHIVHYPLRQGALINVVAVEERGEWAAEGWDHRGDPDALRAAFAGFNGPVQDLLGRVETVGLWGLFKHPVARPWGRGPLVLLGDAAHPTLPFLAQGANLALEDAWVLAGCIARSPTISAAAKAFEALRAARVRRALAAADANARNYHLRNPLVRQTAHALLRVTSQIAPRQMLAQFDWLYGEDVTRNI